MPALHKNRVKMTVSGTPGTGTITLNVASSTMQSFAAAYGANATVDILLLDTGGAWGIERNAGYVHSGTTITRGTYEASSTGSNLNLTSAATVEVILTAARGNSIESALQAVTPGGRLTLESGVPVTTAGNTVAVSGQDTSADTITVTAHGWSVATMVTSSDTSGGLTAGTQYYVGNVTTNTVSLHTTVAAALAGTSKVDITGTVTASISASGVANTSIYYTPYIHNIINLWDGANWVPTVFTEKTLALGTLTSGKAYDVFGYLSAGALVLELGTAWSSDTARAAGSGGVSLQDGRYCKGAAGSEDKTRLLLGTFYTTTTTTTEDSLRNRLLSNVYNKVQKQFLWGSGNSDKSYTTVAWQYWNNSSTDSLCRILHSVPVTVGSTSFRFAAYVGGNNARTIGVSSAVSAATTYETEEFPFYASARSNIGIYQPTVGLNQYLFSYYGSAGASFNYCSYFGYTDGA